MSDWQLSADGTVRTRTEYWLMYERHNGEVRRWMSFSALSTALSAIPDAERATPARRWGIRTVEVTERVIAETQWQEREGKNL